MHVALTLTFDRQNKFRNMLSLWNSTLKCNKVLQEPFKRCLHASRPAEQSFICGAKAMCGNLQNINLNMFQWKLIPARQKSSKKKFVYQPLNESELEESFIHGSGPGGQNVNKLANCVMLKHLPTGLVVKCHETRTLPMNRDRARLRMQERLDQHLNRENSQIAIAKRDASRHKAEKKSKTRKKLEQLKEFKEREGLE